MGLGSTRDGTSICADVLENASVLVSSLGAGISSALRREAEP